MLHHEWCDYNTDGNVEYSIGSHGFLAFDIVGAADTVEEYSESFNQDDIDVVTEGGKYIEPDRWQRYSTEKSILDVDISVEKQKCTSRMHNEFSCCESEDADLA